MDGELKISTGERLLFRQNNKAIGVRNGDIGTVKAVNHAQLKVELDSGERLTVPRDYQAIDYGYALTVHKSQGMTAKHTHVLIDSKKKGVKTIVSYSNMQYHRRPNILG